MAQITSFTERARASMREEILDAATDLLSERGYAGLRMADVAAAVGVSRQTVYNEFGSKSALVQAVALRTASEFLEGIRHRLAAAADLTTAIHDATVFTIEHGRENRLVAAALGTHAAEDLLPLLTTRGEPILRPASELAEADLTERVPHLREAALIAETMVRLTLSYLMLPALSATDAADAVCGVIAPLVEHYSSSSPETGRSRS